MMTPLPSPWPPGTGPEAAPAAPEAPGQVWNAPRDPKTGRLLPGGPGRPRGTKNKRTMATLEAVQDLAPSAVKMLAVLVAQGDPTAIKLVLQFVLPRGGRTIDLDGTADPNELVAAFTSGQISPDEFARAAQGWKTSADAAELKELTAKIEELEALVAAMRK